MMLGLLVLGVAAANFQAPDKAPTDKAVIPFKSLRLPLLNLLKIMTYIYGVLRVKEVLLQVFLSVVCQRVPIHKAQVAHDTRY